MKIIISPAKKMNVDPDTFAADRMPEFVEDAKILMDAVRSLDYGQAKALWKCNDKLARLNYEKAVKQYLIAAGAVAISMAVPVIIGVVVLALGVGGVFAYKKIRERR